jgi:hypothetical protein
MFCKASSNSDETPLVFVEFVEDLLVRFDGNGLNESTPNEMAACAGGRTKQYAEPSGVLPANSDHSIFDFRNHV